MPPEEAGYTYAVEPTATHRLLANEEESIYRHSIQKAEVLYFNIFFDQRCRFRPTPALYGQTTKGKYIA